MPSPWMVPSSTSHFSSPTFTQPLRSLPLKSETQPVLGAATLAALAGCFGAAAFFGVCAAQTNADPLINTARTEHGINFIKLTRND